jgi:hypothetical protein
MPKYNVDKEIWLGGLKQPVGTVVTLAEAQAKYLSHALTKVEDKPVEATAAKKPAAKKAAAGAVVSEQPAEADANGAGN